MASMTSGRASFGDSSEIESELIKRNREIAKLRDDAVKKEMRLEECQARNSDLLEKIADLDQQVTVKNKQMGELEAKMKQLTQLLDEHKIVHEQFQRNSITQLDSIRKQHEEKETSWHQERGSLTSVQANVAERESMHEAVRKNLEEEKLRRQSTQNLLDEAELEKVGLAGKSVDMRRRIKELEKELEDQRTRTSEGYHTFAEETLQLEQERTQMKSELAQAHALLEEHRSSRDDIENLARTHQERHSLQAVEIDDLRREQADHASRAAALEKERDEAVARHNDHRAMHDALMHDITKRNDEHIEKISKNAADLDGRLGGQRMMLDETMQALTRSEREVERLTAELLTTSDGSDAQRVAHEGALARLREEVAEYDGSSRARASTELEEKQSAARQHARELADQRAQHLGEIEEQRRTFESQISCLRADHGALKDSHERQHDSLRGQHQDLLRSRSQIEERAGEHQRDAEQLLRERDEAERRTVQLSEELRKAQAKQFITDPQVREAREQAAMAVAEATRLRGHLDELRYMLKVAAVG